MTLILELLPHKYAPSVDHVRDPSFLTYITPTSIPGPDFLSAGPIYSIQVVNYIILAYWIFG